MTSLEQQYYDATVCTGNTRDQLASISKVLKAVSSTDALVIFAMAKEGIEADTITYSRIGLTRKQYYTRLMQLKNADLIQKKGNQYYQTTMGSFLYENCINAVTHAIRNRKNMGMIDVLTNAGNFTAADLLQAKNSLFTIKPGGTD